MPIVTRNGTVRHRLSEHQVRDLIDREARKRLAMSGEEFIRRLKHGSLPESVVKRDIAMLFRLIDAEKIQ